MKNLPDQEWFSSVKHRLRHYTEDPDDDSWDKILGKIQRYREPVWVPWSNRMAALISLIALLWLLTNRNTDSTPVIQGGPGEKKVWIGENKVRIPNRLNDTNKAPKPGRSSDGKETTDGVTEKNGEAKTDFLFDKDPEATAKPVTEVSATSMTVVIHEASGTPVSNMVDIEMDSIKPLPPEKDTTAYPVVKKEAKRSARKKRRLMLYASVTPLLAYQKVTPAKNDGIVVSNFKGSPVLSGDRLGVITEVGVQGRISGKLEFYSGFSLYKQSQTLTYQYYQSGEEVSVTQQTDFDYTLRPGSIEQRIQYDMTNIGGQAGILYYIKGERLQHKFGAGLSHQYGIRRGMKDATYDNAASQYLFYQLFYRNEYSIGPSMKVFVQPFYSHAIFANEKLDAPFKLISNRAGIGFGITYSFSQ